MTHIWIVEYCVGGKWRAHKTIYSKRGDARRRAQGLTCPTRVVKFVPERS
jgi:hypothetical protein